MSSGTPYIGSKISLVSKAEIRYEGYLYTIDQNDSTVTLAKVISLGTEDRVPDSPVPAREEVFEYIVFRGSDIKDLHVCEGPKRVEDPAIVHQSSHSFSQNFNPNYHPHRSPFPGGIPNFGGGYNPFNFPPNGPADCSSSRHGQHTPPNLPRNDNRGGQPKNQISSFQDNSRSKIRSNEGRYKEDNDRYVRDNRDNSSNKTSKENRNISEHQYDDSRDSRGNREVRDMKSKDNRVGRGNSRMDRDNDRRAQRSSSSETKEIPDNRSSDTHTRDRKDTSGDSRDNKDRRSREREYKDNRNVKEYRNYRDNRYRQSYVKKDNQEERDDQQRNSYDVSRGQPRGRGGRGYYSGRGSGNRRGAPRGGNNRTKFTEDFDFETANAKFNKEEIEKELLKVLKKVKIKDDCGQGSELKDEMDEREMDERAPLPSPDKFYDRSKSFFDNIFCEAMIPKTEDEVMTRRQEQALNAETFGTSASHFRPGYRGRGRGRGRWRGGQGRGWIYRARGNYRGNSNRRWVDYEFDYEAAGIKNRHQPLKVSSGGLE